MPGDPIKVPLNYKLWGLLGYFMVLVCRNQCKREMTFFSRVIYPSHQEGTVLFSHNGVRKKYESNTSDPVGCLSIFSCSIVTVNVTTLT